MTDAPDDLPPASADGSGDDGPWGPDFDAEVAAHDNLSPHPMRARIEKMLNGMDEIRAMYPTPEARAEGKIKEAGWLAMEASEAKIREIYPAFKAEDDRVIERFRRAEESREELNAARAEVNRAFAAFGVIFN